MRHGSTLRAVLSLSLLVVPVAGAAPAGKGAGSRSGSLTNAGLIGSGRSALYGTVGWPGMTAGYLHGVSDTMDFGARVTFAYGCQGAPSLPCTGLEISGDLKLMATAAGLPGPLVLRVQPGVGLFAAAFGYTALTLEVPIEVLMGFQVLPQLTGHLGLQIPFAIGYNSTIGFGFGSMQIPIWPGGGLEYALSPAFSVHGQIHMGPYIAIAFGGINQVLFGFESVLGATYRF
jgi:hypothetical protein